MLMLIDEQEREMEDALAAASLESSSQRGSSSREHDPQQPQPLQPQPPLALQQPQGGNGAGGTSELQEIQLVEMRTL